MTYTHGASKPPRPTSEELKAEMDRLKAEEEIYRGLIMQQARLTQARNAFHRQTPRQSVAERVRMEAIARYNYQPEECRARLETAAAEAYPNDGPRRTH